MDLLKYDGKKVKIETASGEIFEGPCRFFGDEYCEHEFGRNEACLEILGTLFFESQIANAERLGSGPDGGYSAPFGQIEEMILEDPDADLEDVFSEGEEQVLRLVACAESRLDSLGAGSIPPAAEWERCLDMYSDDLGVACRKRVLALIEQDGC